MTAGENLPNQVSDKNPAPDDSLTMACETLGNGPAQNPGLLAWRNYEIMNVCYLKLLCSDVMIVT